MITSDHLWILTVALVLDGVFGDPRSIWQRIPHPVAMIGAVIGFLDRFLNRAELAFWARRALGIAAVLCVVALVALAGWLLEAVLFARPLGWLGTAIVASVFIAGRSLYDHVLAVANAFALGTDAARTAVAKIVGRDPASLDESRIARAAIESTAENFSDAVVAPAMWLLLLGLPGLIAYKAINTADSMIGHRTARHEAFGWGAARLDDLVNLPASRFAGLMVALAAPLVGGNVWHAFSVMLNDAPNHRSPNAGWPEAAMGAALGVSLAGPRRYGGTLVDDAYMNVGGRRHAGAGDVRRALRVYLGANAILFALVAASAVSAVW